MKEIRASRPNNLLAACAYSDCLFAYVYVVEAVFFENMCSMKVFSGTDSVVFPSQHVCVC